MEVAVMPSKNSLLLRALTNIALGIIILVWPGLTLLVLIYAFAINILLVGLMALFEPAVDKTNHHGLVSVLLGLTGIVVGIYLLARPLLTGEIFIILIALWAIMFGIADIYIGLQSKLKGKTNWLFVITGVFSLLFSIVLLNSPLDSILALIMIIGFYSLIVGVTLGAVALIAYPKK